MFSWGLYLHRFSPCKLIPVSWIVSEVFTLKLWVVFTKGVRWPNFVLSFVVSETFKTTEWLYKVLVSEAISESEKCDVWSVCETEKVSIKICPYTDHIRVFWFKIMCTTSAASLTFNILFNFLFFKTKLCLLTPFI